VKKELVGQLLTQEDFNKARKGVVRNITVKEYAGSFRQCYERWNKCIRIEKL
jgi:hypothetical protein